MDANRVANIVIELLGGREAAYEYFDKEFREISNRWDQDSEIIGRLLRAHLFVEHFLTEYLASRNPQLGSLEKARLTFSQKLNLIGNSTDGPSFLIPGIKRLNQIRNRIAHNLGAEITKSDVEVFLGIKEFESLRKELAAPAKPSEEAIHLIEEFSRFVGTSFQATINKNDKLWAEAIRIAQAEEKGGNAT